MHPPLTRHALKPHPTTPCRVLDACSVELELAADSELRLRYTLLGHMADLLVPPPRTPAATDGLWAHTCCEAFFGLPGSDGYREFNFSPSGQWAIYDFAGYRDRVATPPLAPPAITTRRTNDALILEVRLAACCLPGPGPQQVGISAVVESVDGALSYWALRHPGERPDFHHRDARTLTLPLP